MASSEEVRAFGARKATARESQESESELVQSPQRVKVTFSLPREVVAVLRELARERGISMTEVLRQAVTTEKFLTDAQKEGDEIILQNNERKRTRQLLLR